MQPAPAQDQAAAADNGCMPFHPLPPGRTVQRRATRPLLAAFAASAVALAGAALPRPAWADVHTRWACWLSDSQQDVACLLDQAPALQPASDARERIEADQRAAAARLDPRLPPQVRSMRLTPQAWRAKVVFIPLHGVAFADSALEPLAQAVLCGSMPHCRAEVAAEPASHGPRYIALLADANDPLLAD